MVMGTIVKKSAIKNFAGKILGYISEDKNGNQRCTTFAGKILGYYDSSRDVTLTYAGKLVARGNSVVSFLYTEK